MPAPRLLTIITALILLQGQVARAEYSLEQLQEIERYVMSKNSAALETLLRSNPELMAGNDPLAKELRSFMENNLRQPFLWFNAPTATLPAEPEVAPPFGGHASSPDIY